MISESKPGMKTVSGLGPTGRQVADNVRSHRERQNLAFAELARRTAEAGREIPALGLRRIEALARRIDVDDVMVLAVALGVSPLDLLLPARSDDVVEVTGVADRTGTDLWEWATKTAPLDSERKSRIDSLRKVVAQLSARERDLRIDERAASDRIADLREELRAYDPMKAFQGGGRFRSEDEIRVEIRQAEFERAEARVSLEDLRTALARVTAELREAMGE